MAHVVAADLSRGIGQAVLEHARRRQQQQARGFDGIAGDSHDAGFLALLFAVFVKVHHAGHFAGGVVLDAGHMGRRADFEIAGGLGLGDFGVQRGPFRAALAALEAKAQLHTASTAVTRLAVDGHIAGVHFLVAQLGSAGVHDLEVVVAGQAGNAVGAGDTHFVFGFGVVGLQVFEGDGPVQQISAWHFAVCRLDAELMLLEAQRCAGPVGGRAAHGFANPGWQAGKVFGDAPGTGGGACVQPGQLHKRLPLVVDKACARLHRARLEDHNLDALLAQFVGQCATARARTNNDDYGVVRKIKFRHVLSPVWGLVA